MLVNKHFIYLGCVYFKKKTIIWNLRHIGFHIGISAPLSAILLILGKKMLHPLFWAYQRVLGGMYGNRVHTSLLLSLNYVAHLINWTKMNSTWLKSMYELLMIHIIAFVQATLWGVTLQTSDQIPSPVDWEWKYSKSKEIVVDWCGAYDVNLNDYIFSCTCKVLCIRCQCLKKGVLCLPFCSSICILQGNIVYIILKILFIHM